MQGNKDVYWHAKGFQVMSEGMMILWKLGTISP